MTEDKVVEMLERALPGKTDEYYRARALSLIVQIDESDLLQTNIAFGCAYVAHNFSGASPQERLLAGECAVAHLMKWRAQQILKSEALDAALDIWQNGGRSSLMKNRRIVFWVEGTGKDRRDLIDECIPKLFKTHTFASPLAMDLVEAAIAILYCLYWGKSKTFRE